MSESTVHVVGADPGMRRSTCAVAHSAGLLAEWFASGEEFLRAYSPDWRGCLILGLRLGDTNGLDLQDELRRRRVHLPVIFMTKHGDVPAAVRALKGGAVDFLQMPVPPSILLASIRDAIELERRRAEVAARVALLTPREQQVMDLINIGKTSQGAASELGLSVRTVEVHRRHMLQKMRVHSTVELLHELTSPPGAVPSGEDDAWPR